tara:strand:- start:2488 stop:3816 length:1329 start_codon:yes stop_codon:yes gene_type:complete
MQMVYAGNNNALVFPTMCDAYIKIEYGKHNQTQNIGLWQKMKTFTCQFVITPYDVNGFGDNTTEATLANTANGGVGVIDSKKTMPASADAMGSVGSQSDQTYLETQYRYTHKMCLFHNEMMTISLANQTTFNQNQPAEYAIEFKLTLGTTTTTLTSPTVFQSRDFHYSDTSQVTTMKMPPVTGSNVAVYDDWHKKFLYQDNKVIGEVAAQRDYSASNETLDTGSYGLEYSARGLFGTDNNYALITFTAPITDFGYTAENFHVGMVLMDEEARTIGTVVKSTTGSFSGTYGTYPMVGNMQIIVDRSESRYDFSNISSGENVYVAPKREALYLLQPAHIAVSYDDNIKRMSIFYKGQEIATTTAVDGDGDMLTDSFSLGDNDIYIGQNASLSYPANRKTQFMGEIHELSISSGYQNSFGSVSNILTPYRDTLLYYNFEEGVENG